jgi:hypothetical protein
MSNALANVCGVRREVFEHVVTPRIYASDGAHASTRLTTTRLPRAVA